MQGESLKHVEYMIKDVDAWDFAEGVNVSNFA